MMSKSMADTSNILINGVIFSTRKNTDPHTVRGGSTQKDERIFRKRSFRELKIAKESNDLADLAKFLPESYQKSNKFSVNRKCGQNVAADDRRTNTDKDKVRRVQTLGNDNKDAMLDCERGFHQRGEERTVKFLFSLFISLFFSLLPNFFGRFSLLPDFSPFSLISLSRGLFYLLIHRSASLPHVLKEGEHTKHVWHVDISRSSHTTFRFCHLILKF